MQACTDASYHTANSSWRSWNSTIVLALFCTVRGPATTACTMLEYSKHVWLFWFFTLQRPGYDVGWMGKSYWQCVDDPHYETITRCLWMWYIFAPLSSRTWPKSLDRGIWRMLKESVSNVSYFQNCVEISLKVFISRLHAICTHWPPILYVVFLQLLSKLYKNITTVTKKYFDRDPW